ncbi:Down syndrome cell adhesion molecule-like protein CG42256 [Papilio machaon]|uniref:Down syndrome cell adhesion molecule-like protein CG42256 n=1 Tax=Papilio machaon TaxID=76193 RepID=A0A194RJ15_PAPMA|nr:Down syndrome cell adhesion molecule-like protein CG42256 [Papilio machaon]
MYGTSRCMYVCCREALPNGTLVLNAFSAAQYRGDVHAALYRCRAAGPLGTVLSRDMRLQAGTHAYVPGVPVTCGTRWAGEGRRTPGSGRDNAN